MRIGFENLQLTGTYSKSSCLNVKLLILMSFYLYLVLYISGNIEKS